MATVGIQQAAYTVREVQGVQRVCITVTGMREIDLRVTFSTQAQTAQGKL